MLATAAPCWQLNSSPDRITLSYMEKGATLTVRLSSQSLQALRRRARLAGVTPSDLVRTLIDGGGARDSVPTAYDRTAKWVGAVSSRAVARGARAREELEAWDPDRRG